MSCKDQSLSYLDNVYLTRKTRHFNVVCSHVSIFVTYILVWAKEKAYGQLNEKQCDKVYDSGWVCVERERERDRKLLTASTDPEECQIPRHIQHHMGHSMQLLPWNQVTYHPKINRNKRDYSLHKENEAF